MFPLRLILSVLLTAVLLLAAPGSVFVNAQAQDQQQNTTASAAAYDEEACNSETTSLNTDPVVQAAVVDLKDTIFAAVQDDFFQFCSVFQRKCTVNLNDYSTALQSNCTAAGGQIATSSARLDCTGKVMGVPIPGGVGVEFANIPACVGRSCDTSRLPAVVVDSLDQILLQVETEVENGLEDGNCTTSSARSSLPTIFTVAFASTVIVVWSMLF